MSLTTSRASVCFYPRRSVQYRTCNRRISSKDFKLTMLYGNLFKHSTVNYLIVHKYICKLDCTGFWTLNSGQAKYFGDISSSSSLNPFLHKRTWYFELYLPLNSNKHGKGSSKSQLEIQSDTRRAQSWLNYSVRQHVSLSDHNPCLCYILSVVSRYIHFYLFFSAFILLYRKLLMGEWCYWSTNLCMKLYCIRCMVTKCK